MDWLVGIITICGLVTGSYSLMKINRAKGIIELILAVLCPVLTLTFCSLRSDRAFGGTKWEFLIHSATIDRDIWPYIILILFIVEIICIVRTILTRR